ncbi:hypothetical protein [Fulvimarina sp. MAC8]|uniref:hypothetical protein n=1 Tax=Fulvimarina sp. MAC8 TaxID=3162874 RepID=UPI0032EC2FF0
MFKPKPSEPVFCQPPRSVPRPNRCSRRSAWKKIEQTPEWDAGARPFFQTVDAFFDWIEFREERYELVDGVPVMVPYVKRPHARIVSNIDRLFHQAFYPDRYMVTLGDFAIQTGTLHPLCRRSRRGGKFK